MKQRGHDQPVSPPSSAVEDLPYVARYTDHALGVSPLHPKVELGFLIHDLSRMRRTFFDQKLKPLGVTRAQWWALAHVARHPTAGITQVRLAEMLEIAPVTVGGLLDRLEDAGLVRRELDRSDRRVRRIFISEDGWKVIARMEDFGREMDELVFRSVTSAEVDVAMEIFTRVKNNLRLAISSNDT